ncbi:helix-loop-helix DNA-binding domain-containing protein [Abortiporus biennis]|nr:helix-loop-helix DNA-binding domain-containing protein [Abortiporus biennis]
MSTAFYSQPSFKPQVLSRTEGFHLPSPAPSTPPSSESTPGSNNGTNNSANNFDTHNLFITPPSYLSIPETFRKFPGPSDSSSMDFSEELASLIANPPNSHHQAPQERSTQSPSNAYDDYRPHTHNIFDISAPNTQQSQFGTGSSAFSLPSSSMHSHSGLHPSSLHNNAHPLHEFTAHSHFNSTVPAIGSSMRYEPGPPPPPGQSSHPFTLNPTGSSHGPNGTSNTVGAEPSSVSSFSSHISNMSNLSNFSNITTSEFHINGAGGSGANGLQRQTPSPVSATSTHPDLGDLDFHPHHHHHHHRIASRSRSRSRAPSNNPTTSSAGPPSTNGGPTRRTRAKRNSVSSVSPPPLHRHTQPLVIPNGGSARGPASPLSLSATSNPWFISGQNGEYSLPTPDSVHGGFSAFTGGNVPGLGGVSPKEVSVPGLPGVNVHLGMNKSGESPPLTDMAAKQAMLANEKRRRRRESHNAVERRRRDNINEKISELATLIPECLLDPAASLGVPNATSGASAEELLFGGVTKDPSDKKESSVGLNSGDDDKEKEKDGGKESLGKDESGTTVKANKGMILRKSVEYIRYLQQLVTAQASRNRDLEDQLQTYRSGGTPSSSDGSLSTSNGMSISTGDGEEVLMLHEEVGDFAGLLNGGASSSLSHKKGMSFSELESVEEMDMEDDLHHHHHHRLRYDEDQDHDMDRPSTAGGGENGTSPSVVDDGEDGLDDSEEQENRGRRGRDGKVGGESGGASVKVKEETKDNMEAS